MTKIDLRNDFIKNAHTNKMHIFRKKYLEKVWEENKDLRLAVYKRHFINDNLTRQEFEELLRTEGIYV